MTIADPRSSAKLDWTLKGTLPRWEGLSSDAALREPLSLFDDQLPLPVALLKREVVRENSAWMRRFLAAAGVEIAPHGKTTMAPELFRLQEADGIWGVTAATAHHVRAYREFGVRRVFLANQLIGTGAIEWVFDTLARDPDFDFYCLADSVAGVQLLERAGARVGAKRTIQVLVEVGRVGGRAGVRTLEQGLQVGRAASQAEHVDLVGVSTFEGIVQGAEAVRDASEMIEGAATLARSCDEEKLFASRLILSGGGSAFFDLAANLLSEAPLSCKPEIVIRSGCYLTHDDGLYRRQFDQLKTRSAAAAALGFGLQPALEIWAHVQSIPEPGRMICSFGKRDAGADIELPMLKAWFRPGECVTRAAPGGFKVTALFDQHAYVDGPAASHFQVGDLVGFGVSHPCTTFDKWRALLLVDDSYRVVDVIRTYF